MEPQVGYLSIQRLHELILQLQPYIHEELTTVAECKQPLTFWKQAVKIVMRF